MYKITDDERCKEIVESYKKILGHGSDSTNVGSYTQQQLEQIIKEENQKILQRLLDGYRGKPENSFENVQIQYHKSEITNNKRINILMVCITSGGMFFLAIGIVGRLFNFLQDESISIIGGVITEVIGVIIKALQTASDKSKHNYFEALLQKEYTDKVINLVENMNEGKDKNKMIEKIVDGMSSKYK